MKRIIFAFFLLVGFSSVAFGAPHEWVMKQDNSHVYSIGAPTVNTDGKLSIIAIGCDTKLHVAFLVINWGEYVGQKGDGATLTVKFDHKSLLNGPDYTFLIVSPSDTVITGKHLVEFISMMRFSKEITVSGTRHDNSVIEATWSLKNFNPSFHQLLTSCSQVGA